MKAFNWLLSIVFVWLSIASASGQEIKVEQLDFKANNVNVLGELRVPSQTQRSRPPLVLVLPNAGGLDGTGPQYIAALNQNGIATIELNLLTDEDWLKNIGMTLGATRYAVEKYNVDPQRVGIMGFSHGAMVSLVAASELWMNRLTRGNSFRFKAHASLYPLCSLMTDVNTAWYMNWKTMRPVESGDKINAYKGMFDQLAGGKVLLLVGESEDYEDAPIECPKLLESLNRNSPGIAQLTIYPGAGHGWDVPTNRTYNHSISRKNGTIRHHRSQRTFELSRSAVVDFFISEFR